MGHGELHGFGRYVWPEGSVYEGTWQMGEMSGQGRYESWFDGDFLEGTYSRNCYRHRSGRWINVAKEHEKMEQLCLARRLDRDTGALPVHFCSDRHEHMLTSIREDGLVPFVVATTGSPLEHLGAPVVLSVRDAAVLRRRHLDCRRVFYDAIREALLQDKWLAVVFDDEGAVTPDEWRLEHFFDPFSFPLDVFNQKLFNGRGTADIFLPEEMRPSHANRGPMCPGREAAVDVAEPSTSQPMSYRLSMVLVSTSPAPCGGEHDVRTWIEARYSKHAPLHRTAVIVCSNT